MARRAQKVFGNTSVSPPADTKNYDGYPAWNRPLEERYLQALLTNTLGNTFYADSKENFDAVASVNAEMIAHDPDFMAKAIVFARQKGYMRTVPIWGLAALSKHDQFEEIFDQVINTPNDLMDFAAIVAGQGRGEGGRRIKRVAGNWLTAHMTEYWAIKYGASKSGTYSLRDLYRIYHPVRETSQLVNYILRGGNTETSLPNQIEWFERLKKAHGDHEKVVAILNGRLPHEVSSTFAGTSKSVWSAIIPQMPIFALLRNLATLERHDVLNDARQHIERKFSAENVQHSKILPFRFLEAEKKVQTPWVKDMLRGALEHSFGNLPEMPGTTAVFLDISGSMLGDPIQRAAIFGVALMKKVDDGMFMVFDTKADEVFVSKHDSILTQAAKIKTRGGTDTGAPIRTLLAEGKKVDQIILITDEQQNEGRQFLSVLEEYKRKVNRDVKTFIVNVQPYGHAMASPQIDNVWWVYGWSESVLNFISLTTQGFGSMVEQIRRGN